MGSIHNLGWRQERGKTVVQIVKTCVTFGCLNSDAKAAYREKKLSFFIYQ
jgi:hypothetical protein